MLYTLSLHLSLPYSPSPFHPHSPPPASPSQPVLLAESYGGDDEPVDTLLARFTALGISSPVPPLRVKETPSEVM